MMNNRIDALIEAGRRVLESDFCEVAFENWRTEALACLTLLNGADHPYTEYFRSKILQRDSKHVLGGVGVLSAAGLVVFQAES